MNNVPKEQKKIKCHRKSQIALLFRHKLSLETTSVVVKTPPTETKEYQEQNKANAFSGWDQDKIKTLRGQEQDNTKNM